MEGYRGRRDDRYIDSRRTNQEISAAKASRCSVSRYTSSSARGGGLAKKFSFNGLSVTARRSATFSTSPVFGHVENAPSGEIRQGPATRHGPSPR